MLAGAAYPTTSVMTRLLGAVQQRRCHKGSLAVLCSKSQVPGGLQVSAPPTITEPTKGSRQGTCGPLCISPLQINACVCPGGRAGGRGGRLSKDRRHMKAQGRTASQAGHGNVCTPANMNAHSHLLTRRHLVDHILEGLDDWGKCARGQGGGTQRLHQPSCSTRRSKGLSRQMNAVDALIST